MKKIVQVIEYIDEEEHEIIRRNLDEKGIQVREIAKKLNISRQYISSMFNGKKPLQYYLKDYLRDNDIYIFED